MYFVVADASVLTVLTDVVELNDKRFRSGGERTCVRISGVELGLEYVRGKAYGEDITDQFARIYRKNNFYLAEDAQLRDCESLL